MRWLSLPVRLARRDLRGGIGSFWILVVGIALGVAAIAGVGSVAEAVLDGVRAGARASIGGDVTLRLFHRPATPEQSAFLKSAGRHSETAELRPLAHGADGRAVLVELKAADAAYPLYGTVGIAPPMPLQQALAERGAVVDQELLDELGLGVGDRLRLGDVQVAIRGVVTHEPDRTMRAFSLGPRVMIGRDTLEASGLAPPGAQVYWYNRVRLPAGTDPAAWIAQVEERFPDAGWRIVNADDGVPGIERVVLIGRVMLVLVGLSVLLIGGVGVASAVSAHLARKTATIAILKSVGAGGGIVFATFLLQVLAAAAIGIAAGLALGALAPAAVRPFAGDWLPLGDAAVQPGALLVAALFGLATALLFALWPLARAQATPPQHLFRDVVSPLHARPGRRALLVMAALAAGLFALLVATSGMPVAAAIFAVAALATVLLFLGLGKLIAWAAGRIRTRRPLLRLALGNLSRPGAATAPVVMALGLSLTLLVAIKTIEGNALAHLAGALPREAPELVFINVPPARGAEFDAALAGAERAQRMPFLHARVTHVAGTPAHALGIPADLGWVVRGDRGLSWAAVPPAGGEIVAGQWWEPGYRGAPLASLDAEVARRLGLAVGDRLTLNVLGAPVEVEIANLRRVDWTRLGLDFPILLSPPAAPWPHSEVAAVWAPPDALDRIEAAVLQAFPESPPIRVAPVLETLGGMVRGGAEALSLAAAVTIVAALLVLVGSVSNGYRRRVREMILLKVVGARPRQLLAACAAEFVMLGAVTAALATLLGTAAAWAVVRRLMPEGWVFLPAVPAVLSAATLAVMLLTALLLGRRALSRPPADVLRQRLPVG